MGKRFGRNQKRKLRSEIKRLEDKIRYVEYSHQPISSSYRTYSYGELFETHSLKDKDLFFLNPVINQQQHHLLDIYSRIIDDDRCKQILATSVLINGEELRHYIDTDLFKNLLRDGYPMDNLYKHLYEEFKMAVEKAVKTIRF